MRVSQLAKEIEKDSKEIIAFLERSGIEGKKAQSGLEDAEVKMVHNEFGEKEEKKAEETPAKKKKIIFVSNPQNSKNPGQVQKAIERKPKAAKPQQEEVEKIENPSTESRKVAEPKVEPKVEPKTEPKVESKVEPKAETKIESQTETKVNMPNTVEEKRVSQEAKQMDNKQIATSSVADKAPEKKTVEVSATATQTTAVPTATPTAPQTTSTAPRTTEGGSNSSTRYHNNNTNGQNRPNNRYQNDRPAGANRPQGERSNTSGNYQGNRYQGNNPQGNNRPSGYQGNNYQGSNYQGNNAQGTRPSGYQGNNYQGSNYQGNNAQGTRPSGYQGNNYQGSNYQGNNAQGTRPNGYQGNNYQGSNYQGNNAQGGNTQGARPGGYQGNNYQGNNYQGNNYQGNRPQADRGTGNRYQGGGSDGRTAQGGARPGGYQGNRPYNNNSQGNRPYNGNSAGPNRGPGGNNRYAGGNGGENNRFGKPTTGKATFEDAPLLQNEKRRDDAKRKLNQDKDSRSKRDKIYEEDKTLTRAQKAGRFIRPEKKQMAVEEEIKVITIPEILTIKDLAEKMKIQPAVIVKKLFLKGQIVTVNQEISYETAEEIAIEYEIMCEAEEKVDVIAELLKEEEEDTELLIKRPPVICVMGHVDHGKTSLLDAIRKTNVIDKEAGGITQHIGAYTVNVKDEKITFLDTPGHEAFTAMRMRGANATDIAILVVAADDGVMPQTVEAISHAKAAGIEIIVAVNKIDKPSANMDRVKQELTEYELVSEDWGGSTIFAPVSAKTGEGIENLLEMILLTSEILELKANATRDARGLVIEAQLDKGRGPVATILVQKGTLNVGDFIAVGACHGKVRAMIDDKGRRVKEAGPSTPVEILGLNDVPNAGEVFVAPQNDKEAKQFAETFISQGREKMLEETKSKMSLDDLFTQIQTGSLKELNLIVKADVQGSVEAVKQSLLKLSNEEVVVKVIHGGVGAINESDIMLGSASAAIIIGFNVRPDATAKVTAEREAVDVRLYKVIYQAIEDIEAAMKGMLDPVYEEKILGHAEVRQIFKASAIGNIAGSYVLDGIFQRNCKVRITREGTQIFEGNLDILKRFKDEVKEVKAGFECGLTFEGFDQVQEFDVVEAYTMVEVPR